MRADSPHPALFIRSNHSSHPRLMPASNVPLLGLICLLRRPPKKGEHERSTDHGFLKFHSIQVFDKIAMFGLKDTSLVWHTHDWGLIKDFLFLSQLLRHFSLTEVGKQSSVVMGNSSFGVKTVLWSKVWLSPTCCVNLWSFLVCSEPQLPHLWMGW